MRMQRARRADEIEHERSAVTPAEWTLTVYHLPQRGPWNEVSDDVDEVLLFTIVAYAQNRRMIDGGHSRLPHEAGPRSLPVRILTSSYDTDGHLMSRGAVSSLVDVAS